MAGRWCRKTSGGVLLRGQIVQDNSINMGKVFLVFLCLYITIARLPSRWKVENVGSAELQGRARGIQKMAAMIAVACTFHGLGSSDKQTADLSFFHRFHSSTSLPLPLSHASPPSCPPSSLSVSLTTTPFLHRRSYLIPSCILRLFATSLVQLTLYLGIVRKAGLIRLLTPSASDLRFNCIPPRALHLGLVTSFDLTSQDITPDHKETRRKCKQ
jgi:hypothetical protein